MPLSDPLNIVGETIADKYRIEQLVGEGGFALVYRAIHTIWKKPVAIKLFSGLSAAPIGQREELMEAFIQEGALLTDLSSHSANIVQARDVGTYVSRDGQWMPFMVLEWLDGKPLDDILEAERAAGTRPWTLPEVLKLFSPVAAALEVAHRRGIAHRDIKPANLFVLGDDPRSGSVTVKVLDFGVAKMMSDNTQLQAALARTGPNITSFTPQYGAPEQFSRTYGATGPWTDVFALALIAVEMLAGEPALEGIDVVQLAFSAGNPDKRPTPRVKGAPVSDAVEAVFREALALKPEDRYPTAIEFWHALQSAAAGLPTETNIIGTPVTVDTGATALASSQFSRPMTVPRSIPASHLQTGGASTASVAPTSGRGRAGMMIGGLIGVLAIGAIAFYATRGSDRSGAVKSVASAAPPPPPVASSAPATVAPPECPEGMVKIPAGQYFMGSDQKDALANEKPSHNVKLDAYCIGLYEVTARDYKACSDDGKCRRAGTEVEWPGITKKQREIYAAVCTAGDVSRADHPINCITWEMASTYCKAQGGRLPSEAEWEYATRGPDGRVYPWGDDDPTAAHLNACGTECVKWGKEHGEPLEPLYSADDGYPTTAPVGKFPKGRSRFGPYDVVGNVWEWVADWYGDYDATDKTDPTGPPGGEKKVIRGGAWNGSYATWLRPSFRFAQVPNAKSHGIGFRCASDVRK